MTNIIITNQCNARCDFCFAQDFLKKTPNFLSLDKLEERIQLAKTSGLTQVRIMGGEPTLHPQFNQIVEKVMDAGFTLIIFSNGFITDENLSILSNLSYKQCALLININANTNSTAMDSQRNMVLKTLNKKITLGYTILNPVFDLLPTFLIIQQYGLQPKLRLGLAMPIYNGGNKFLTQKHYPLTGNSILQNVRVAEQMGIRIEFDCGFVRCMFTDEEWKELHDLGISANLHCGPNLDIDMDDSIFHCFSLQNFQTQLDQNHSVKNIYTALMKQREPYQQIGIYPECSNCKELHNANCSGGCLSLTLQRFHS